MYRRLTLIGLAVTTRKSLLPSNSHLCHLVYVTE